MNIKHFYEISTNGKVATEEEIATILVNINKGMKLAEIKTDNEKIYFVLEDVKDGD